MGVLHLCLHLFLILLIGLHVLLSLISIKMGARSLLVRSDSWLIKGQVTSEYQAKDPQMAAYLEYVRLLKEAFVVFELVHIPRE